MMLAGRRSHTTQRSSHHTSFVERYFFDDLLQALKRGAVHWVFATKQPGILLWDDCFGDLRDKSNRVLVGVNAEEL